MAIPDALRKRRARKEAQELLRHARHFWNTREDLLAPGEQVRLQGNIRGLACALKERDMRALPRAVDGVRAALQALTPSRALPGWRENIEVLVVAIAVAMGVRTYFLQPFKIPTGSMQPTLFGITSVTRPAPSAMDRLPLKLIKWAGTGKWYRRIEAQTDGHVRGPAAPGPHDPSNVYFFIAGRRHRVPKDALLRGDVSVSDNQYVRAGHVLWSGYTLAGDHVFVDKVRWNFRRPRRGDIMVFNTRNIPGLPRGTHYIKRLSALPGESVSIRPPHLLINDAPVSDAPVMETIARAGDGYAGYQLVERNLPFGEPALLRSPSDVVTLGDGEYFSLGDNTENSRDSRYWGPVPRENLAGPAVVVYWPFTKRWGRIR